MSAESSKKYLRQSIAYLIISVICISMVMWHIHWIALALFIGIFSFLMAMAAHSVAKEESRRK